MSIRGQSQWTIHHRRETISTNLDARQGVAGDVFTADFQSAGRGRLDHKWLSPRGTNLMMSAVLSVANLAPEHIATLPLVVGLAVTKAVDLLCSPPPSLSTSIQRTALKWPNDVLIDGKKVAGILCERVEDQVIAGIGVNVKKQVFPPEIAARAIALGEIPSFRGSVDTVRDTILAQLSACVALWRVGGFAAVYPSLEAVDYLRGQTLAVRQTDDDAEPVRGVCGGINPDGSLDVGGVKVYAGEAHVEAIG